MNLKLWEPLVERAFRTDPNWLYLLPLIVRYQGSLRETYLVELQKGENGLEIGFAVPNDEDGLFPKVAFALVSETFPAPRLPSSGAFLHADIWSISLAREFTPDPPLPKDLDTHIKDWKKAWNTPFDIQLLFADAPTDPSLLESYLAPLRHHTPLQFWPGATVTKDGRTLPLLCFGELNRSLYVTDPDFSYRAISPVSDELSPLSEVHVLGAKLYPGLAGEPWVEHLKLAGRILGELIRIDSVYDELLFSPEERANTHFIKFLESAVTATLIRWREYWENGVPLPAARPALPKSAWGFESP